jgi:tetratricopeptide (TPR) repeat protein
MPDPSGRIRLSSRPGALLLLMVAIGARADAGMPPDVEPTPPPPFQAPYFPAADDDVLQQVPAESDPAVRSMITLRASLDAAPESLATAAELAHAYIDFGRQIGDAHYAGYAEAVLAPWLAKPRPPVAVLVLRATILQYRHQFVDARELLHAALKREPRDAQAWLTLATLDMVQGDYESAAVDCAQVAGSGGFVLGIACAGSLRSYLGKAQQGIGLLTPLENDSPDQSTSFKAWIQGLLAESSERLGNWSQAESHYRKALGYAPRDNFLRVAFADFLLDRDRPKEVLTMLAGDTQSDTAFLRLALAHAALGSTQAARYAWIMAARFEALAERGSEFYGREQARFALHLQHDPQTALALAQRNWQVQRAPWDMRVLLESALAADQPQAATPALAFLDQTQLQDPVVASLARELRARLRTRRGDAL